MNWKLGFTLKIWPLDTTINIHKYGKSVKWQAMHPLRGCGIGNLRQTSRLLGVPQLPVSYSNTMGTQIFTSKMAYCIIYIYLSSYTFRIICKCLIYITQLFPEPWFFTHKSSQPSCFSEYFSDANHPNKSRQLAMVASSLMFRNRTENNISELLIIINNR